jgi:nucleoside-diphosphate-sugar epimerase
MPCKETSPFNPMDMYHRTKLAGELAILAFASTLPAGGMVVTVNRPAMVYGPGDLRMLKLFKAILQRRFLMIGSGEVKAHLGYVEDQVDSLILCALAPRAQPSGSLQHRIGSADHPEPTGPTGRRLWRGHGAALAHPGISLVAGRSGVRADLGASQVPAATVSPQGRLLHPQSRLRSRQSQ